MEKVYIIQDELDFDGGGRPKFVFSDKSRADKWCERLNNEQTIYDDWNYEVVEYSVDEITDLSVGYYRVYISKEHIIDACDIHLAEYKNEVGMNKDIMKCVGNNRIAVGVIAHSPKEAKEKAIKRYDEVEASGFFEQKKYIYYDMYIKKLKEGK